MSQSLPHYMNGYGTAQLEYFTTEAEAIAAFDQRIDELARYQTATYRDAMLKKKYVTTPAVLSDLEKGAREWG